VIDALEVEGERALGLEGFELESTTVHPRVDLTYDASVATRVVRRRWLRSGAVRPG